jgi:DNA adenine methylase
MNRFSPLRYPGGKGKLAPYLTEIITRNGLEMGHYAEPFAGGAAVALDLLFSERVRHIHINDIDPCVYAFWHSVVHNMEAMIERIEVADISIETWLAARETKRKAGSQDLLDLGFATFFLSRTNRSGILNGGVIGGLAQEGAWKIDCRFNKEELISRIRRIGFYKSRISVCNMDASLFLSDYVPDILESKLLYIDPPYYVKGALLYQNHYKHADHLELSKLVANLEKCCWVVSYDNVEPIAEMYSSFDQEIFSIDYTARTYAKGTEIMVFSPELNRPAAVYCNERERRMVANA